MCSRISSLIGPKGRYPLVAIAIPFVAVALMGLLFPTLFGWLYDPSPAQRVEVRYQALAFFVGMAFLVAFVHLPPIYSYLMAVPYNVRRWRRLRSAARSASNRGLSDFFGDRRGNITLLTALMMVPILFTAGLAVEYSLTLMMRQRMTNALDAAVLAAGREITFDPTISDDDIKQYVKQVFTANLNIDALDESPFSLDEDTIVIDRTDQTISATAGSRTALRLIKAASKGYHTNLMTSSNTKVSYGRGQIEIALLVDVTTSMKAPGSRNDLGYLQDILNEVADILLSDQIIAAGNVRVAFIPFASGVNVGPRLGRYVFADYGMYLNFAPSYIRNVNPPLGYDREQMHADFLAGCGHPPICLSLIAAADHFVYSDGTPIDHCANARKKPYSGHGRDYRFVDAHPGQQMVPRDARMTFEACPATSLIPLTTDRNRIKRAIAGLRARGNTQIHTGFTWSWFLLSHNWRNHLQPTSQPADPATEEVRKVIIAVTDGDTSQNYAYNTNWPAVRYGNRDMLPREYYHRRLCDAIKAQGIEIFGILYKKRDGRVLPWCVSPDTPRVRYLYNAETPEGLEDALEAISDTMISTIDLTN